MSVVDDMLERVIEDYKNGTLVDPVPSDEAQKIIDALRKHKAQALIDWFEDHMLSLLTTNLQGRFIMLRSSIRKTNGGGGRRNGGGNGTDTTTPTPVSRFEIPYSVEGNVKRKTGDMTRPDWKFIIDDRSARATKSLFEIGFAKRIAAKLPDDVTPTSSVVTEAELERFEELAQKAAERTVSKFA